MITQVKILRWFTTLCLAGLLGLSGCGPKNQEPKRADHKAAHTARYHPDIARRSAGQESESEPTSTQPADSGIQPEGLAVPAGISDTKGPVGCPVLFVNGDPITTQEILEPIINVLEDQSKSLTPGQYQFSCLKTINEQIDMQVGRLIVYQEARVNIPEKAQEMIEKDIDRMLNSDIHHRFQGIHSRYEAHLKSLGLTLEERKESFRRQVVVMNYLREHFRPMIAVPSRRELMRYYQKHKSDFFTPAKADMFLIEIPFSKVMQKEVSGATEKELAEARKQARERLDRAEKELERGVDFTEVAKSYSMGVRRALGGAWGEISPGSLTGRWKKPCEVLLSLKEGQVSDIQETDESMFIVKCGKQIPELHLSFEKAQQEIVYKLNDKQYERLRQEYMFKLISKATIDTRQRREFLHAAFAAAPQPQQKQQPGQEKINR